MAKTDLFTRARANLVLAHPFFGALALRMKVIEDPSIETACTDGSCIRYNPDFINGMSLAKVTGVVAHEVMHPAMLHHTRMGARDPQRWNMAADYAINPILVDAGFDLPDKALNNPAWKGMSAEEIYNLLPPGSGEGQGNDPGGCGGVDTGKGGADGKSPPTQSEIAAQEAEWKVALAQAAHMAKQQGKLPAGLERLIEATLEPQTNWRQELHQFCNTPIPADVTWNRPNRRFISSGLYLPSRDVKMSGRFVAVIDTSGSIGPQELNEFGSEIKGIVDQMQPEEVIVMYCDAAVAHVDRFGPHDELTFAAHGGGGTDFRPPFQWLEKENIRPDALVYLTDGYGSFPDEEDVDFPTLWAINNRNVIPPFGVHIVIEV
jgi:predicted metal-dependent peptidase